MDADERPDYLVLFVRNPNSDVSANEEGGRKGGVTRRDRPISPNAAVLGD